LRHSFFTGKAGPFPLKDAPRVHGIANLRAHRPLKLHASRLARGTIFSSLVAAKPKAWKDLARIVSVSTRTLAARPDVRLEKGTKYIQIIIGVPIVFLFPK